MIRGRAALGSPAGRRPRRAGRRTRGERTMRPSTRSRVPCVVAASACQRRADGRERGREVVDGADGGRRAPPGSSAVGDGGVPDVGPTSRGSRRRRCGGRRDLGRRHPGVGEPPGEHRDLSTLHGDVARTSAPVLAAGVEARPRPSGAPAQLRDDAEEEVLVGRRPAGRHGRRRLRQVEAQAAAGERSRRQTRRPAAEDEQEAGRRSSGRSPPAPRPGVLPLMRCILARAAWRSWAARAARDR